MFDLLSIIIGIIFVCFIFEIIIGLVAKPIVFIARMLIITIILSAFFPIIVTIPILLYIGLIYTSGFGLFLFLLFLAWLFNNH